MLDVKPLSTALGTEVVGLDLAAPLDSTTIAALRRALLDHLVLLFRDQTMGERDQVRFAACFGEQVGSRSTQRRGGGNPQVMLIGNVRENGKPVGALPDGELMFHADSMFLERALSGPGSIRSAPSTATTIQRRSEPAPSTGRPPPTRPIPPSARIPKQVAVRCTSTA